MYPTRPTSSAGTVAVHSEGALRRFPLVLLFDVGV